jgi:hypothetical protein
VLLAISIRVVKSRKHVKAMGEERCIQSSGRKSLIERGHLEDLGVDGRIILK